MTTVRVIEAKQAPLRARPFHVDGDPRAIQITPTAAAPMAEPRTPWGVLASAIPRGAESRPSIR